MNAISWLLAISTLVLLMTKAMDFHQLNICRQEAWLKSTEFLTRSMLTKPTENKEWHLRCQLQLIKANGQIFWQRLPSLKRHSFSVELNGKL
jgi:hypothetical protein